MKWQSCLYDDADTHGSDINDAVKRVGRQEGGIIPLERSALPERGVGFVHSDGDKTAHSPEGRFGGAKRQLVFLLTLLAAGRHGVPKRAPFDVGAIVVVEVTQPVKGHSFSVWTECTIETSASPGVFRIG